MRGKMKIAMMTNNYKPFVAGVPVSIERLARGLQACGHQVTVFAPTYGEKFAAQREATAILPEDGAATTGALLEAAAVPQEDEAAAAGALTEATEAPSASVSEPDVPVFRYASLLQNFVGGIVFPNPLDPRIEEEFRRGDFDVIHVHHPMLIGRTAVYLSRKYHVPLVFTYHTRYEQYLCYVKGIRLLEEGAKRGKGALARGEGRLLAGIQEKIVPFWLRTFLRHCSLVFAPTEGMKEYLTKTGGYPASQVAVLPTGLEKGQFQVGEEERLRVRSACGAEGIPLFLSVSRMAHEKNVAFLLRSAAEFKERFGRPFRLLLIGEGPNKEDYLRLSRELGLEEEVIFAGKMENSEITPYYAAADAFLFASKTETQGIVLLEAFAGGTPVIALDATGVRDLVEDGKNGFLCPEEEAEFARRILELVSDRILLERFSETAQETAQKYKEEFVAESAAKLYNKIIAEHRERECWKNAARRELLVR